MIVLSKHFLNFNCFRFDGRKRLSGSQYKRKRVEKQVQIKKQAGGLLSYLQGMRRNDDDTGILEAAFQILIMKPIKIPGTHYQEFFQWSLHQKHTKNLLLGRPLNQL
ncbi:hypothetical protein TNCV_2342271 [Trichonephila clavipes]|nr:hypothetical protein TNCV_2342271 [Trichonephila clavipes]